MASIFNSLHIGYSGLNAAQVGISTTGHNIANAESEGYTRQRVVTAAATPIQMQPGQVGNGAQIMDIKRVFDNFVFDRYSAVSSDKEYSDYEKTKLEELSSYFPEIEGVGIKADLAEYYNMWQSFADNPDNDSIKIALAKQTETLTQHIGQTQSQIVGLQLQVNNELAVDIKEVNSLAQQLADLNINIDTAEAGGTYSANDLRDKRNVLERSLSRLIGGKVNQGQLTSNIQIDTNSNTRTGSYTLSVNGFNIVDGNTYHPLKLTNDSSAMGFYSISYERQDGTLIPMEESINNGKIGAILDLRGDTIDSTSGMPTDGIIQNVITQMDAFAKGLIEATNNLYASSSSVRKQSNALELDTTQPLVSSNLNINNGEFGLVVHDIDGKIVARRNIKIDAATSMTGTNSIQAQIKDESIDDNGDGNANNNIDDFFEGGFSYAQSADGITRLELSLNPTYAGKGYTFSIEDVLTSTDYKSGTNFAGAIGIGRYFDGDNAQNIKLSSKFEDNPTKIQAGHTLNAGDNRLALNMVQQQFEKYNFEVADQIYNTTIYGMFDITSTYVGIATNAAITRNETVSAQFNASELEYSSVSKVSIDEEMTNLIKYQTSYGAAAKVITTIDQMMQTLLGIKQ